MHRRRALPVLLAMTLLAAMPSCSDDDPASEDVAAFCETIAQDIDADTGVGGEIAVDPPSAVEAEQRRIQPVLAQLQAQAPAEISDDVKILTDHLRRTYEVLERYGYDHRRLVEEGTRDELAMGSEPAFVIARTVRLDVLGDVRPGVTLFDE
jgi:hypothetical protein